MRLVLLVVVSVLSVAAHAQAVYKWTDARGVVHYGDRPPADAQPQQVDIAPPPPAPDPVDAGQVPPMAASGTPAAAAAPAALDIVMYARSDCGYCAKARRYFAQRGIGYLEKDVQRDAQANAEWKRLGGRGVPLFVINRDVSSGFSESGMARRLARYGW